MPATLQGHRRPALLGDLFESLTDRGRRLLGWREGAGPGAVPAPNLTELGERLLSRRGEASGVVIARALLAAYQDADPAARLDFLTSLARDFGPDAKAVKAALAGVQGAPDFPEALKPFTAILSPVGKSCCAV